MPGALDGRHILVTGASGVLGGRLLPVLQAAGARLTATSRDPSRHDWPAGVDTVAWDTRGPLALPAGVEGVVNLAGASIGETRWTRRHMQEILRSRVEGTRHLAAAIAAAPKAHRPRVLVNASAVGYYGIAPEGPCVEDRAPGDDFLARVVVAWEAEAGRAPCRVVCLRSSPILDPRGGALRRLLPVFRLRLGGPLGSGRQPFPWVHHEDASGAIAWALAEERAKGAYNLAAPEHIQQRRFAKALGAELGVFQGLPTPGIALRVVAGRIAPVLLGGQHTPPDRMVAAGYRFRHPALRPALADLLQET